MTRLTHIAALPPITYRRGSLPRPLSLRMEYHLEVGFALRCFQRLSRSEHSYSALHLAAQPIHKRFVQLGPLVLESALLNIPAPTTDRDRTVLRRSEPSSRAALMGEQPNPWDLLQPQDATSRHRGAKPPRRYELLGEISLLSPEYLLSFERWPFHAEPPDHFSRLSTLFEPSLSQSSTLVLIRSAHDYQPC